MPEVNDPDGYEEFGRPITDFMDDEGKADFAELMRAYEESGNDSNRVFTAAFVGNEHGPHGIHTLSVQRGKPEGTIWPGGQSCGDSLEEQYNSLREFMLKPDQFSNHQPEDIGPIEQAWFVLCDDCTALDPPMQYTTPEEAWKGELTDEWNALMNKSHDPHFYAPIWARRKITFQQLVEKVKNMVVAPPNPNAKYHWYDRTD
jgi:hypothetical protein